MKKTYIFLMSIMLIGISCHENIIDEKAYPVVTADEHYATQVGYENAVKATYTPLRNFFGQEEYHTLSDYGTDIITEGNDGRDKHYNRYSDQLNPRDGELTDIWNPFYTGINTANAVVNRQDLAPFEGEKLNQLVGEARFLRAMYYYYLTQIFGDVHFTLEETIGEEATANRTPVSTIFQEGVIPDLEFAIEHLVTESEQSDWGRATKGAAQALLAKVYAVNQQWDKVATLSEDVINSGEYELYDDYFQVWDPDNQDGNSEVIFAVQYDINELYNGDGNRVHHLFLASYDNRFGDIPGMRRDNDNTETQPLLENARPFVRYRPTPYMYGIWKNNDRWQIDGRYSEGHITTIYCNTDNGRRAMGDTCAIITLESIDDNVEASLENTEYSVFDYDELLVSNHMWPIPVKHLNPDRPHTYFRAGNRDFYALRLAEVYLLAAEAYLELNNPGKAMEYFNELRRKRAIDGMEDDFEVSSLDIEDIFEERAVELYGEGHRWYFLKRRGELVSRVKLHNTIDHIQGVSQQIQDHHILRPIPQGHIDLVDGEYPQNPGYEAEDN